MLPGTIAFLPLLHDVSSSFTSAFLRSLSSCRLVHLPSFSVAVSPGACACLAHTGDSSNSKHGRVKTNPFCPNENKPLSFLLALSLSHTHTLALSPPLSLLCSFCRSPFSLATVKINCSVSIYFTKEDLTTAENLSSCFRLYLPNFHARKMLSEALICCFVALK